MGLDESNNGRFPEIFAAVFSDILSDIEEDTFKKVRDHKNLFSDLGRRDYSFLLISEQEYRRIPKKKLAGVISTSLIQNIPNIESLEIFIDGGIARGGGLHQRFYFRFL